MGRIHTKGKEGNKVMPTSHVGEAMLTPINLVVFFFFPTRAFGHGIFGHGERILAISD